MAVQDPNDTDSFERKSYRGRLYLIFAALMLLYGVTLLLPHRNNNLMGGDAQQYYAHMRSLLLDGDINLENDAELFNRRLPPGHDPEFRLWINAHNFSIGPGILWTPFFLVAHLGVRVSAALGASIPTDGYSLVEQSAVGFASVLYGCAAMFLTYAFLCRTFNAKTAFWSTVYTALATSFIFYQLIEPHMSHVLSAFAVALFLYLLTSPRSLRWPWAVALGASLGLMILVRWQNALLGILLLPNVYEAFRVEKQGKAAARWIVTGTTACIVVFPQLLFWHAAYGQWLTIPQGGDYMRWHDPHILSVLFSLRHGLFTWTPLVFLCVMGLILGLNRSESRRDAAIYLAVFVLVTYVNACVSDWWGNVSFGMRRYVGLTPLFAWGLAVLFSKLKQPGISKGVLALHGACIFLIAFNVIFIGQWRLDMIPHNESITLRQLTFDKLLFPFKIVDSVKEKLQ